jgi:protein-disulfide isomerase
MPTHTRFPAAPIASAALLAAACAGVLPTPAAAAPAPEISEEAARARLPRADLSGLNGEQRVQLVEIAGDTFDYAGCKSTLAACLRANLTDKHAPRMAKLAALLLIDGVPQSQVIFLLEQYYGSFPKAKRRNLRSDDCGALGDAKAPVSVVEYSDYQCPHCATALKPLHDLVAAAKGKVRFCSKYFPLPGHARARPAAAAAEYARAKGKFWEMNELLFGRQDELEDANLLAYARQLGLDGKAMLGEINAGRFNELIERHLKEGSDANVRATPSVFFNGRLLALPIRPDYLAISTEDELEWSANGGGWDKSSDKE